MISPHTPVMVLLAGEATWVPYGTLADWVDDVEAIDLGEDAGGCDWAACRYPVTENGALVGVLVVDANGTHLRVCDLDQNPL